MAAPSRAPQFHLLQVFENRLGFADLELSRRFDGHMRRHAVVNDDRKALTAHSHAKCSAVHLEPEGFRDVGVQVFDPTEVYKK